MEPAWSGPHAPGHFSALQGWQGLVREPPVGAHILHIYEDPDREIEAASLFVLEGVRRAERVCCVGSSRELASIRRRVEEAGLDADRLVRHGALALVRQLDLEGGPRSRMTAYAGRKPSPERPAAAFWDVLRNHSRLMPAGELGVALELFPTGVHESSTSARPSTRSRRGPRTRRTGAPSRGCWGP